MSLFKNLTRVLVAPVKTVAHVVDEVYIEPLAEMADDMAEGFGVKKRDDR